MHTWFNLPNGETAQALELTVPVKGRVTVTAIMAEQLDALRDELNIHEEKHGFHISDSFAGRLKGVIRLYESVAESALSGANDFRNDALVMFKSLEVVCQSIETAHTHREKDARLRGLQEVIQRHIANLRDMTFDFRGRHWDRFPDAFRWDTPERRLLEKVRELQRENEALKTELDVAPQKKQSEDNTPF